MAVDPPGVRRVLAAAAAADRRGLTVVAGTQRRHEACYREAIERVEHDGAIGRITSGRVTWNMGGLWSFPRRDSWSDMEWQLRNWLYFTWLSGDHIVEQHVHNLDVANWAIGNHPLRALGLGGRQVRTQPQYGQVFDHFAIEYEYPGGAYVTSFCRQIDGCANRVEEAFSDTEGHARLGQCCKPPPWVSDNLRDGRSAATAPSCLRAWIRLAGSAARCGCAWGTRRPRSWRWTAVEPQGGGCPLKGASCCPGWPRSGWPSPTSSSCRFAGRGWAAAGRPGSSNNVAATGSRSSECERDGQ